MSANLRKWAGVFWTIVCYYLIHEGAHFITAVFMGTFERVEFMFPGIRVVTDTPAMTDLQLAVFCVTGALATLLTGYALTMLTKRILNLHSKAMKAAFYYITLGMLLCDPVYLSVLCGFFGGGDMNGIILFGIPKIAARIVFGAVALMNIWIFIKFVYPAYKTDFQERARTR